MMEEEPVHSLRRLMASHSPPLHALAVPSEDYHLSEYVSERDKRRKFVSGFTGTAGLALITMDDARLWTDGRYFLQATQELKENWKLMRMKEDPAFEIWTADNLPVDASIGLDPWCVSVEKAQKWEQAFSKKGQKLVWLTKNLVDEVWKNRPKLDIQPVQIQPLEFSGCSVAQKLKNLREKLSNANACGIVVTTLDEVAWLFNVRGNDIAHCPVVHAFAIVTLDSAFFYVDKKKVPQEVHNHLTESGVEVKDYDAIGSDVKLLASGELGCFPVKNEKKNSLVWLDPASCCFAIYLMVPSSQLVLEPSPLALSKALKNPVELEGLRKAHIRDGAAVVQFLVWLDGQMQDVCGAAGYFLDPNETKKRKRSGDVKITEASVSDKLEGFRAKQQHFKSLSFGTISSVGPNAALNHYSPKPQSCSKLDPDSIYLFDSGAQYQDGTTDITRTVHFGKPSIHEKACYTAVLKGHIALDTAIFPRGTPGHALDILARLPLWKDGLDYRHGTGHGVGSYLNVHEGPHFIGSLPNHAQGVPLQPSMTVTNEPGYYEDGSFGIRLENVLVVNEAKTKFNFGNKGYLCFENITWAPYQKKLMNLSLLSPAEIEWLNNYHSKCRNVLAPYMNDNEKAWLVRATEPIVINS